MAKGSDHSGDRFRDRERKEKDYKKQLPEDDEPELPDPVEPVKAEDKPSRNDPCPCGSGKKYKKCCGQSS